MPIITTLASASKKGFEGLGLPVYYSNLFVRTETDYLSIPANADLSPGTSAFTVEFFIYPNTTPAYQSVFSCGLSGTSSQGFEIALTGTTLQMVKYTTGGTLSAYNSTLSVTALAWNYIVLTRRSTATNDLQWFVNGTGDTAGTATNDFIAPTSLNTTIGVRRSTLTNPVNAYISNLRYRIGVGLSSAPTPTSPLLDDANTRLLTCQSATIIDNATPPNTITSNGVTVSTLAPF